MAIDFQIKDANKRIFIKSDGSNRLKTLGLIQDVNSFIVKLWQALQLHRPGMVFEPAYPEYILDIEDQNILRGDRPAKEIPEEIVTWSVVRRQAGSIDHHPFARSKEIRPRIREELVYDTSNPTDPLEPEMHPGPGEISPIKETGRVMGMQIKGQFFDNLIQFDVWSKNNKTAERLANYLENFMEDFHGMFIELGVTKMHFHSRVRDEMILNWRNGLVNRSLLYYVRTERVKADPVREIRTIDVSLDVREYLHQITQKGIDKFIAGEQDQIVQRWLAQQAT